MKRRDFLQLVGLAGAAAALPAPLQALAEGPLDEELPLKLTLCGRDVRSIEFYLPELRNITHLGDNFERFVPVGPPRIHLELNWVSRTLPEPSALVDLEVSLEGVPWKTKAYVKSCCYRVEQTECVLSMELLPTEAVKR